MAGDPLRFPDKSTGTGFHLLLSGPSGTPLPNLHPHLPNFREALPNYPFSLPDKNTQLPGCGPNPSNGILNGHQVMLVKSIPRNHNKLDFGKPEKEVKSKTTRPSNQYPPTKIK